MGRGDTQVQEVALAFVGSLVPDEPEFHNPAFNRSGNMFVTNLLLALQHAGLIPSLILSVPPLPSFPGSRRLWSGKKVTSVANCLQIQRLPFLNITPIKQLSVGLFTIWGLLCWRWKTRHIPHHVVYSFNLTVPPGLFILLGARLIGARAIVSLADINVPGETVPSSLAWKLDFWLQRQLIPNFDGTVAVVDEIMKDFAPGRPYIRVEGGITQEVLERTSDRFRIPKLMGSPFTIVSTGSLNEINGIGVIMQAFALLEGDHYRLRVAGMGALEGAVKEAAAKDPRIEYCGFVSFEEVLALYNSADLLINMRLTKALNTQYYFPSKLMEYLASGVPVITTCTGHVEEEFGDFTFLLKDETPQGLADLIQCVATLKPAVRFDMGRRAREYMRANKSWDAQGMKIVEFIRERILGITA
jgi:glycosyltransferase involved in cell wall biosynthesis